MDKRRLRSPLPGTERNFAIVGYGVIGRHNPHIVCTSARYVCKPALTLAVWRQALRGDGGMSANSFPRSRWLAVNALGILVFLARASRFWIEPELAEMPGASGGAAFGWIAMAAPIFAIFFLANLG